MRKQILYLGIIILCSNTINLFGATNKHDYSLKSHTLIAKKVKLYVKPFANVVININRTGYYYDLGTSTSEVQNAWTRISPETTGDISWSSKPDAVDRGAGGTANNINRDFCYSSTPTTFNHKIKNGDWIITMNMGDRTTAHDNMRVVAEGITLTSGVNSAVGAYSYVTGTVTVTDGELNIELSDTGGTDPSWVWNRLSLQREGVLKGTLKDKYGDNLRAAPMTFAKRYPGPLIYAQDINSWWALKDNYYNAVRLNWVGAFKSLQPNLDVWTWDEMVIEMDKVVANAVATGMTVIIDYHNVGEQDPRDGVRDDTMNFLEQFWTTVAPRYKDNDHVIYELQNEPCFSYSRYTATAYKTRFLEIYNMVRSMAPNRQLIIFSAPHHNYMNELVQHYEGDLDWDYTSAGHHLYGGGNSGNINSAAAKHRILYTEWEYDVTDLSYAGPVDGYKEAAETLENINQSWFDWSTHDGPILTHGILIPDTISKGYQWWTDSGTTVGFTSPGTNDYYYGGDNVNVKISATDNGSITNVKLFLNGVLHAQKASAPYNFTLNNLVAGKYVLRTEVIDNEGNIEPRTRDFSVLPETASSSQVLNPTADAFVQNNSTQNGTGNTMSARHAYVAAEAMKAYMKFDMSGVTATSVKAAKLRVYNTGTNDEGWVFLHELLEDSWTENGITWSNGPKNKGLPGQLHGIRGNKNAAITQFSDKQQWVEWDVTEFVNQEIKTDNNKTVSFQLSNFVESQSGFRNRNKTDQIFTFGTKESSTPPQLILAGMETTVDIRPNLALNKPATQSSFHTIASNAVNGNIDDFHSTLNDTNAWWEVDLGAVSDITTIEIYNRTALCCTERLSYFHLLVSDVPFTSKDLNITINQAGIQNYYSGASPGRPSTFNINNTGRYVRVQLAGTNYLHMAEIMVFGKATLSSGTDLSSINSQFSVYPNPTSHNINLDMKLATSNKIAIKVHNMLGQVIYQQKIGTLSPGNHTLEYNKDKLNMRVNGMYIIELKVGDIKTFKKILLNR